MHKEGKVRKQSAIAYNIKAIWRTKILPRFIRRLQMRMLLSGWERRSDAGIIRHRLDYYCPESASINPDSGAKAVSAVKLSQTHSCYWFDMMRYLRAFPKSLRISFIDGDTHENPDFYSIGKARRLDSKKGNVALMKLDSRRHFIKVEDNIPFRDKKGILFFRGDVDDKQNRIRFFEKWGSDPRFDIGDTSPRKRSEWMKPRVPVEEHFRYKYILALEGNDVATAVQWICASGCIPVMCRPTVESWFMHGLLQPGVHYIEIKPDFSDVAEKIEYYNAHPEEAESISRASREWATQFDDPRRESIISYLVAKRYLRQAN